MYFSTLLPDPNPTRYPVFFPIPDPTRPDIEKPYPLGTAHVAAQDAPMQSNALLAETRAPPLFQEMRRMKEKDDRDKV